MNKVLNREHLVCRMLFNGLIRYLHSGNMVLLIFPVKINMAVCEGMCRSSI